MRSTTSAAAIALALLQTTHALNYRLQRKLNLLADMGLNADGSAMNIATMDTHTLKSFDAASAFTKDTKAPAEVITAEFVELPLDHFPTTENSTGENKTFKNRFWVREEAYMAGGPVFIFDVGEQNAGPSALFRLQNETSFFKQLVDQFRGIGIVWEHRYYGNSTPEPINLKTKPEAFRYLTTEQSLADVDHFAKQFMRKNISTTLTPNKTPWVFVGGSYPGMRAAFIRNMYPNTIYASYASSAPVQASIDQSFYFSPIWRGMNAYGWGNCTQDIQAAIHYIDDIMDRDQAAAAKLKEEFLGAGAGINSHAAFAESLATIFASWQSYGMEGGTQGLRGFCDWIETDHATHKIAPAEGWAKSKGAKFVVDRWADYPFFAINVNADMETNCTGKNKTLVHDCNLSKRADDPDMISWAWQHCTQWGYFQSANLGPQQLVSKFNSLEHYKDLCHRQWPNADPSLLPEWPNVEKTNSVFGGWTVRPSNTYWSNGEFDPWRTLSPASAEPFAPKIELTQQAPLCGQTTSRDELFGYVIPGAEHCFDFRTYFPGGAISRQYFTNALTSWLKCFEGSKSGYGKRFDA